jgi:hypothetical protein
MYSDIERLVLKSCCFNFPNGRYTINLDPPSISHSAVAFAFEFRNRKELYWRNKNGCVNRTVKISSLGKKNGYEYNEAVHMAGQQVESWISPSSAESVTNWIKERAVQQVWSTTAKWHYGTSHILNDVLLVLIDLTILIMRRVEGCSRWNRMTQSTAVLFKTVFHVTRYSSLKGSSSIQFKELF